MGDRMRLASECFPQWRARPLGETGPCDTCICLRLPGQPVIVRRKDTLVPRSPYIIALLALLAGLPPATNAQPAGRLIQFGSANRLEEHIQQRWWDRQQTLHTWGGLSLIGAQWRASGSATFEFVTKPITGRLHGSIRIGPLGTYGPDWDEAYDVLRTLSFARYNPPRTMPLHLRVGTIERMRLGVGHIVSYFSSSVAWDERTVGTEFIYAGRTFEVAGFVDNVLLDGVLGGRVAVRPLARSRRLPLRSAKIGFNYVTDRTARLRGNTQLTAYNVDLQFDLFASGNIFFAPYVSYAWIKGFGEGLSLGADLYGNQFLDTFTFRLRLGALYNGKRFIPAYFNTFYTVNNLHARVVRSGTDLSDIRPEDLAGVPLDGGRGGNALLTELHLTILPNFSNESSHRYHLGDQPLHEFHTRFFLRTSEHFVVAFGLDRMAEGGYFAFFNPFDDMAALVFSTDFRIAGSLHLYLRARYTYEHIGDESAGPRYLVQRRFEPYVGLHFPF